MNDGHPVLYSPAREQKLTIFPQGKPLQKHGVVSVDGQSIFRLKDKATGEIVMEVPLASLSVIKPLPLSLSAHAAVTEQDHRSVPECMILKSGKQQWIVIFLTDEDLQPEKRRRVDHKKRDALQRQFWDGYKSQLKRYRPTSQLLTALILIVGVAVFISLLIFINLGRTGP